MTALRVALTGGIATGKSYCLAQFARRGVPVIDADRLAREAVAPGTAGLAAVVRRFGPGVLRADGTLDRPALGAIVFADRTARAELEAIVHPEVYRRIGEWFATQPKGTRVAMADIPLLFETGHEHDFDRIVVAACAPAEQLRRVMARDGLNREAAIARVAAQWPIDEKAARAHYVIRTDGTFAETDAQVAAVTEGLNADG
ncbi:MAG TPA: dephospho-CoA kinase [Vicinamibacterales bacterium]|nr:dephospho-CoA kinase [Vicinamibacterales bacterium]